MNQIQAPATAKKGLFRIIFSRTGIVLLLLLIQLGIMVGSIHYLQAYLPYIYGALLILEAVVLIYIINTKGNPAFKMTWMLCVMVFPFVGVLFYVFAQMQIGARYMQDRLSTLRIETDPYMQQDQEIVENLWARSSSLLLINFVF